MLSHPVADARYLTADHKEEKEFTPTLMALGEASLLSYSCCSFILDCHPRRLKEFREDQIKFPDS